MVKTSKAGLEFFEWYDSLVFCATLIIIIFLFFFRTVTVDGSSMIPTLTHQDRLVIRSIGYSPHRKDIIVIDGYSNYGVPLVKRIVALAGDNVDIRFETGEVFINGEVLDEPYIFAKTKDRFDVTFPLTVESGKVFVLGDNRPGSLDSRNSIVGQVDVRDILGVAFFRMLPFSSFGFIK